MCTGGAHTHTGTHTRLMSCVIMLYSCTTPPGSTVYTYCRPVICIIHVCALSTSAQSAVLASWQLAFNHQTFCLPYLLLLLPGSTRFALLPPNIRACVVIKSLICALNTWFSRFMSINAPNPLSLSSFVSTLLVLF